MKMFVRLLALLLAVVACGVVSWGYVSGRGDATNEVERKRPVRATSRVFEVDGLPAVRLDRAARERSGIEIDMLPSAPYQHQVQGYGTVVLDLSQLTNLGNSYASANAQLQAAQARLAASNTALARARNLYKNQQNVSLAEFQSAAATALADEATFAAAESQLRTQAAIAQQAFGPVIGKALRDSLPLAIGLIEQRNFLLQVTLPPGVSLAAPPRTVTVLIEGEPPVAATFIAPATRADPRIQGVTFFYLVPACRGLLPGMNVLVSLSFGLPSPSVSIPASAIVWWQDRAWIYRQIGADVFSRIQIPTGTPSDDGGYIVEDLPNGVRIVTKNPQLLLSEEFRAQIQIGDD